MLNKTAMLKIIAEENMGYRNPSCLLHACENCIDIMECFANAVSKSNLEYADSIDNGGYVSTEEFWENL